MKDYVAVSIETHLFYARIMKEHALFLLASFPGNESDLRLRADQLRGEFEDGLWQAVRLADGMLEQSFLDSGEMVTELTQAAECQTGRLTGISIDTEVTKAQMQLSAHGPFRVSRETAYKVRSLNRKMLSCLSELIAFKEDVLHRVLSCRLYTSSYPLLIEHILREAKLYRQIVMQLERSGRVAVFDLKNDEAFWNQIMMEHAQFIRGLLDPSECELIQSADSFADDYCRLLDIGKRGGMGACAHLSEASWTTCEFQKFKMKGAEGILDCQIRSVIMPLLADHVLREANHYLRILERAQTGRTGHGFEQRPDHCGDSDCEHPNCEHPGCGDSDCEHSGCVHSCG